MRKVIWALLGMTIVVTATAVGAMLFLRDDAAAGLVGDPESVTGPRSSQLQPSGPLLVDRPGEVLRLLDVAGDVVVTAPGVIIRDCRISGRVIVNQDGPGSGASLRIEDSEIDGSSLPASVSSDHAALGYSQITARRLDIHGFGKALQVVGDDVTLEDSWLHDLTYHADSHNDGIYVGGGQNTVIRRNLIDASGPVEHVTGAVVFIGDLAPIGNGVIEDNVLTGGGYTVYAGTDAGKPFPRPQNMRFIGNVFTRDAFPNGGFYGPVTGFDPTGGNEWIDNTWAEGTPVDPPVTG